MNEKIDYEMLLNEVFPIKDGEGYNEGDLEKAFADLLAKN